MTKNEMLSSVASTAEILADFRAGKMVILIDDEDRENEGDLLIAADFVTPEAINFMARHARGLVCLTLTEERCRRLRLPLMTAVARCPAVSQQTSIYSFSVIPSFSLMSIRSSPMNRFPASRLSGVRSLMTSSR